MKRVREEYEDKSLGLLIESVLILLYYDITEFLEYTTIYEYMTVTRLNNRLRKSIYYDGMCKKSVHLSNLYYLSQLNKFLKKPNFDFVQIQSCYKTTYPNIYKDYKDDMINIISNITGPTKILDRQPLQQILMNLNNQGNIDLSILVNHDIEDWINNLFIIKKLNSDLNFLDNCYDDYDTYDIYFINNNFPYDITRPIILMDIISNHEIKIGDNTYEFYSKDYNGFKSMNLSKSNRRDIMVKRKDIINGNESILPFDSLSKYELNHFCAISSSRHAVFLELLSEQYQKRRIRKNSKIHQIQKRNYLNKIIKDTITEKIKRCNISILLNDIMMDIGLYFKIKH